MSSDEQSQVFDEVRGYVPWLIAATVLIFGAAQVPTLRPQLGVALALALPVVVVSAGVFRFRGTAAPLELGALVVGGLMVIACEVCVSGGLLKSQRFEALLPLARGGLGFGFGLALLLHALAVRRHMNPRFGAWVGMAGMFAWWLSKPDGGDRFSAVFTAFFLALLFGGGVGLLAGEALRRFLRPA